MARTILVVCGIRNTDQAEEIYDIVDMLQRRLKNRCKGLSIVMISEPQLLRHVVEDERAALNCVSMYVSDSGSILYSGNTPSYPILHENIFLLVVDSLHRIGGSQAARLGIWPKVKEISLHAFDDEDESTSIVTIFARLHKASKDRKRILECLPEMSARTRAEIPKKIRQDNVRIAGVLQELFELNYKRDISVVPVEHATAVLNLTHSILDTRLPKKNGVIVDYPVFMRRAQRLLNLLAGHLGILPEEPTVSNVILLSDYPIAHGGFANIYHGKYTNSEGREQEVALKVLKIFEEQSQERRRILHASFFKEALAYPFRAMVSPWMPQGSVLKYMTQHTPTSPYAIDLLGDVIQGLEYLHSVNVVHGDLCGRNILIDRKGNAQLADFGLTAFIESDTTKKTSTRSGSTRWMAPELIVPPSGMQFKRTSASDIWVFGCVCCEIWSEGVEPFSHFPQETLLIIMFSDDSGNALQRKPYQARPREKGGVLMPERIWEFVQLCWEEKASERPTASVIADMLSEYDATPNMDEDVDTAIPSGSGMAHDSRSPSPSPSTDYLAAESSTAPPKVNKGKQVRFEDDYAVVQFGPLDLDTGPEEAFFTVFEALMEVVPRGALSEPRLIHEYNSDHLHLHFRSPVEANNFTMTWTVHRFEPYLECTARVVDS
ncbi:kinase-like domain-containing protein [Mycena olivaceomarginata]|nr:kinase-like domain-containing protein [Mycena olivaceomarginata]